MKILLVEPNYNTKYIPMSLMKFSSYHKSKGDEVRYQKGFNYWLNFEPDIIYITSLFTWYYDITKRTYLEYRHKFPKAIIKVGGICASLLKEKFAKELPNAQIHYGVWKEVDESPLDYSLFPNIDYSIAYTTRGCVRKCGWCMFFADEFLE